MQLPSKNQPASQEENKNGTGSSDHTREPVKKKYRTRQEGAAIIGGSLRWLDDLRARGEIGYVKIGGKILFRD